MNSFDFASFLSERLNISHMHSEIFIAFIAFAISLSGLMVLKKALWKQILVWTAKTESKIDDVLMEELDYPLFWLLVVCSLILAFQFAPDAFKDHTFIKVAPKFLGVLIAIWIIERTVTSVIRLAEFPAAITTSTRMLFLILARFLILSVGTLIALDTIGVSITPLLASLGVGSIAVALALQDTLGNFFSGLYLLVDRPFSVGDFVQIENDTSGTIVKIGWRSTQILLGNNSMVFVPNSKIASSRLTNFNSPDPGTTFPVTLGVAYESDLDQVEKITLEVAKEIQSKFAPQMVDFEPSVRFHTFADSSINFNVSLRAATYSDHFMIKHEVIKALHSRYKAENISIPYPQRVVRQNS